MKENNTVFKREDNIPITIKGEFVISGVNLNINFPDINQKYFIDIHPIYSLKKLDNIKVRLGDAIEKDKFVLKTEWN